MKSGKTSAVSASFIILLIVFFGVFGISPGSNRAYSNTIEDSKLCLDCHEDYADNLEFSVHSIITETKSSASVEIGCISCHDGWESHIDDPSTDNIIRGSELNMAGQAEICARCHISSHQAAMLSTDPHARTELSCSDCHRIHGNRTPKLVQKEGNNFCKDCHQLAAAQFKSRSTHPLESGNIKCVDCHTLGYTEDDMFAVGIDWSCQNCHSELSGPFIHEHPVTSEYAVNGGGCTECHDPHGSPNSRLLKQPGSGLCLQCHGMPAGHAQAHSGFVLRTDCMVCHSQIHGSDDNGLFLDPDLNMKFTGDCYQSGCHGE